MKHVLYVGKIVAWGTVIALCGLSLLVNFRSIQSAQQSMGGLALQPPAFLKAAYAADTTSVDFSFLVKEAGITAYTKLDQPLDVTNMESLFKTTGRQTDEFISGIMVVPDYEKIPQFGEKAEVQVFLHKEGWIVVYLTKWQRASEIFDWIHYDDKRLKDSTLIENVVRKIANDAGASDVTVSYYDFRNPAATNLILVASHADSTKPSAFFEVTVPLKLNVYESSWSSAQFSVDHFNFNARPGTCTLDENELASLNPGDDQWGLWSGELTKANFSLSKSHKLGVAGSGMRSYCGIAIVYQEATK